MRALIIWKIFPAGLILTKFQTYCQTFPHFSFFVNRTLKTSKKNNYPKVRNYFSNASALKNGSKTCSVLKTFVCMSCFKLHPFNRVNFFSEEISKKLWCNLERALLNILKDYFLLYFLKKKEAQMVSFGFIYMWTSWVLNFLFIVLWNIRKTILDFWFAIFFKNSF